MERNVDMNEISDGRRYGLNDMPKADCHDCEGCSKCCRGMGNSIVLDPLDVFQLTKGLGMSFEALLQEKLELHVVDGVILPNLKMDSTRDCCGFLDENGRCQIHAFRPGICRIFPLGRIYENGSFEYFLQTGECTNKKRTKIKVKKWIDVPDLKTNQKFIADWHYLLKDLGKVLATYDGETAKKVSMYLLNTFFILPYDVEKDFYEQFYERYEKIRATI
nr:YkgJ family cysteine cluster protein [Eubacterium sp.]